MATTQSQGFENQKARADAQRLLRAPHAAEADVTTAFDAQRVYGNRALGSQSAPGAPTDPSAVVRRARLVVQPKLTLGPVDDVYEREADSVAESVVQSMAAPERLQRQEEEEELQMKPVARHACSGWRKRKSCR